MLHEQVHIMPNKIYMIIYSLEMVIEVDETVAVVCLINTRLVVVVVVTTRWHKLIIGRPSRKRKRFYLCHTEKDR